MYDYDHFNGKNLTQAPLIFCMCACAVFYLHNRNFTRMQINCR